VPEIVPVEDEVDVRAILRWKGDDPMNEQVNRWIVALEGVAWAFGGGALGALADMVVDENFAFDSHTWHRVLVGGSITLIAWLRQSPMLSRRIPQEPVERAQVIQATVEKDAEVKQEKIEEAAKEADK
jgi:hypothetical protein